MAARTASGAEVIVVGKKNKRGVIKAKRVLLPSL
jgi:hypothetical protein